MTYYQSVAMCYHRSMRWYKENLLNASNARKDGNWFMWEVYMMTIIPDIRSRCLEYWKMLGKQ